MKKFFHKTDRAVPPPLAIAQSQGKDITKAVDWPFKKTREQGGMWQPDIPKLLDGGREVYTPSIYISEGGKAGEEKELGVRQPKMALDEVEPLSPGARWHPAGRAYRTKHTDFSPRQPYIAVSESGDELFRKVSEV